MFGIGSTEFLVIILVALLVLGPKNLTKVSRTVGRYVGEFRRISTDFQRTLNAEVAEEERQENRDAIRKKVEAAKAAREKREGKKKKKKRPVEGQEPAATGTASTQAPVDAPSREATQVATSETPGNPFAPAQGTDQTQTQEDGGASAQVGPVYDTGPEDMVRPPKGSPLEAVLEKAAREAAEPAKINTAETAAGTPAGNDADNGQGGRA